LLFPFFAGLAAGLLHVFSGPDHLAAVAPMATDAGRSHWRTGLQWGVGHTAGVLMIASLLLLLKEQLPLDSISNYSERIVGLALIAVGCWGVWKASRKQVPSHSHAGASFTMGTIHGLAGSSHLFGVLPALAFATRVDAVGYLAGFGTGAIAGMSAFAAGIGLLSVKFGRASHGLLYVSSAAALVIGGFWLVGH
jgi:hypothetical protein